jgi:hypothetical protein
MQFLHLEPIYDEASDDATIFAIGACIEWQGEELYEDILKGEEEATLLGAFMVRNTDNNAMDVRYWLFPPCRAWDNSPLAGACWTAAAEKWFNGLWQQYAVLDRTTSPVEPAPVPHRTLPKQVKEWVKELQTWDKSGTRVWTAVCDGAKEHLKYRLHCRKDRDNTLALSSDNLCPVSHMQK